MKTADKVRDLLGTLPPEVSAILTEVIHNLSLAIMHGPHLCDDGEAHRYSCMKCGHRTGPPCDWEME